MSPAEHCTGGAASFSCEMNMTTRVIAFRETVDTMKKET